MIYTLNVKSNTVLPVMSKTFELSYFDCMKLINKESRLLQDKLAQKGINYADLKYALIPNIERDKYEYVLVFDMNKDNRFFGLKLLYRLLAKIDDKSPHSFMYGDYISYNYKDVEMAEILKNLLLENLLLNDYPDYQSSDQFYMVYINNVTKQQLSTLSSFMATEQCAVGIADITHSSFFKDYLSNILVNGFLTYNKKALVPNPDVYSDIVWEGSDMLFSFESIGYTSFSIADMYWSMFLAYKIETRTTSSEDIFYSLNALSDEIVNLDLLELRIDESKLSYLLREKQGSLKIMELHEKDRSEIIKKIKQKISESWLYNLCIDEEHNTMKFNVILDYDSKKILLALEYLPQEKQIRLITLY